MVDAAVAAGARKVYLIEEPVAAALGAGIDISKPNGHIIVDIGGGTTDIAALPQRGGVQTSLKVAGTSFDQAIVRYVRSTYDVLIGEKMAERLKMEIGSVSLTRTRISPPTSKAATCAPACPEADHHPVGAEGSAAGTGDEHCSGRPADFGEDPAGAGSDISVNGLVMTGGGSMLHGWTG